MVPRFHSCLFLNVPTHRKELFWLLFFLMLPGLLCMPNFTSSRDQGRKKRKKWLRWDLHNRKKRTAGLLQFWNTPSISKQQPPLLGDFPAIPNSLLSTAWIQPCTGLLRTVWHLSHPAAVWTDESWFSVGKEGQSYLLIQKGSWSFRRVSAEWVNYTSFHLKTAAFLDKCPEAGEGSGESVEQPLKLSDAS